MFQWGFFVFIEGANLQSLKLTLDKIELKNSAFLNIYEKGAIKSLYTIYIYVFKMLMADVNCP